jgi:LysR family transcriptional activator of glutamate synthase operon
VSPNIDLKKLRAFLLVAKNGSLRHAAMVLHVSIPAVSIQIRQLEEELGVALFQRVGRQLVLTATGQLFLTEVETAMEAFHHAVESVSPTAPRSGRIALAMNNDLARYFSARITKFMKDHPTVGLSLRVRGSLGTLGMVMDGSVDVGVGYFGDVPGDITKRVLGKSGFSLACNSKHPLAKKRRPTLAEIGAHRLITLPTPTNMGRRIARVFSSAGVNPIGVIEAGNCQTSREFAEKGIGVALIHTACLGTKWPKSLCRIDVSDFFGTVDIAVIHRASRRLSPALVDFLSTISEA